MGWLCDDKPRNVKEFLDSRWGPNSRVLRSALKLTEYYAAIQLIDGSVTCGVYLLSFHKENGHMQMCRKDMDETCGPSMYNCPEAILKLLTPCDIGYSAEWRAKNWANIYKRKAVSKYKPGARVRYQRIVYTLIQKRGTAWEVNDDNGFGPCRMSRSQLIKAEVINEQA
jgi:hypothetical protein